MGAVAFLTGKYNTIRRREMKSENMTVEDRLKRINKDLNLVNKRLYGVAMAYSHKKVRRDERYLLTNKGMDRVADLQQKINKKTDILCGQINGVIMSHSHCFADPKLKDD